MERRHLDRILDELKGEPVPDVARDLESRILQEIRTRSETNSCFEDPISIFWRSAFSFMSTVGIFALGVGFVAGAVAAGSQVSESNSSVRHALALDVFEHDFGIHPLGPIER